MMIFTPLKPYDTLDTPTSHLSALVAQYRHNPFLISGYLALIYCELFHIICVRQFTVFHQIESHNRARKDDKHFITLLKARFFE